MSKSLSLTSSVFVSFPLEKIGLEASSRKVRALMRKGGFSVADLAESAGVSKEDINCILLTPDQVIITVWEKVCGVFGITPERLVQMEDPKP